MGTATLNLSLVGWEEGNVAPAKLTAAIVVPKSSFRTEPVSPRLIRSLPHPERKPSLLFAVFAPDGRLIVSGYESGIVQVLDPASGKELRTIEASPANRGLFHYPQLSHDRTTVFVGLGDSDWEPVREGEKKTYFRRYSGEVRVYDLSTGRRKESLKVEPRRGVISVAVSPDGTKLATMEDTSGIKSLRAIYLWDVPTGKSVKLRDGYGDPQFSPDGQTVFVTVNDYTKKTDFMYAYSVTTGKEVGRLVIKDGQGRGFAFRPDGKLAALATVDSQTKKPVVRLYDPAKLQPRATLTADLPEGGTGFSHVTFSPEGTRIAAVAKTTVYLWEVESRKLLKSWPLDTPGRVRYLIFDLGGRRLAASTWFIPPELEGARSETITAQEYPQPKVFLMDLIAEKPETIVCPHGWSGRPAFSADGKLLAVGGAGATHVFDVSRK